MKTFFSALLSLLLAAFAAAQQTTPPLLKLTEADHERLFGMVQALSAEQQAGTTESVGYSDQESPVVARDFVQQYLVLERKLTTDCFVSDYCGPHAIYYYPTNITAAAVWQFPAKSKKEAPIAGQSLYSQSAVGHEGVFVISDWGKQKMKSKSVASERRVPSAGQTAGQLLEGGSSQNLYNSLIAVNCTPLPVAMHFDDVAVARTNVAEQVATLRLTDARERYLLDGYDITLTCLTPDLLELCYTDIRTDEAGTASIFASGRKAGTARIRATIDYSDPDRHSRLFCEKEFTVEVKNNNRGVHIEADMLDGMYPAQVRYHISGDVLYPKIDCHTSTSQLTGENFVISCAQGTYPVSAGGVDSLGLMHILLDLEKWQSVDLMSVFEEYALANDEYMANLAMDVFFLGKKMEDDTRTIYENPLFIQVPMRPGTYSFRYLVFDLMTDIKTDALPDKDKIIKKTLVFPGPGKFEKSLRNGHYLLEFENGGGPHFSGTITVTEIE